MPEINNESMFKISYGLFVLTAKTYKDNGCIVNTVQQVTQEPLKISVAVNKENLAPGDILCFSNRRDRRVNHVGIYVGDSKFIHASTSVRGVVKDDLNQDYYVRNYVCARRIL